MTPVQESVKQGIVVIVEDDFGNALTLELLLLSETTYEVRTYANAMEVFESLEEIRQGKPVLFFLDYLLPEVDGLLLCDWLHALKDFREVPTVLITASTEERLKQEAERRGMALIRKPYSVQTLLEVVRQQARK
jgi:two-component system, OmpR family, response regulator